MGAGRRERLMSKTDHGRELFRLTYASRATPKVIAAFDAEVASIVNVSQRNNKLVDVTGLLLAHNGWFVQVLEGPRRQVSARFARIAADPRHGMLEVFDASAVEARLFAAWGMCARRLTPEAAPVLQALELHADFDPFALTAARALALLQAVAQVAAPRGKAA